MSSISSILYVKGIALFVERHRLEIVGIEIKLPRQQFKLMEKLLRRPGFINSRDVLYSCICSNADCIPSNKPPQIIDHKIKLLRKIITDTTDIDAKKNH